MGSSCQCCENRRNRRVGKATTSAVAQRAKAEACRPLRARCRRWARRCAPLPTLRFTPKRPKIAAEKADSGIAAPSPVAYLLSMTAAPKAQESLTTDVASAHDKILIVDFGSQVTQLIARRVREEGVYSEIVPFQKAEAAFREMKPNAVILSGGPESVHEEGSPRAPQLIFESGVPVLGICYGQMTMAAQLGGEVEGGHHREFGRADVEVKAESCLFDAAWKPGEKHPVWMSHGDRITRMPPGFVVAATSTNA